MVNPVSNSGPVNNLESPAQAPAKPVVQAAAPKKDTVELSQPAQARLLKQQGFTIPQIALQMKLDVKTVRGFFA